MALIECSACKNSVSPEAVSCPHCGQPLKPMSEPKQKGGCLRALLIVLGGLALLFLLMLGCSIFAVMGSKGNHSGPASSSDPVPAPAGPVLKVGNWHWGEEYGYVTAEGRVTNISTEKLENVEAVVTFETKGGTVVTTEDGVIEYNPLMPGQSSPWKVMVRANPEMKTATVQFKTMFGGALLTTQ